MTKSELIKQLCENWIKEATSNGGIQIGGQSERYRLRNNGLQFHEFSFEELVEAGVGLTKILLLKGLNTVVDFDHYHFWSWAAEIIMEHEDGFFKQGEHELRQLFATLIRSSFAGLRAPSDDAGYVSLQRKADELMEFNAQQLVQSKSLITAYLGFPLLEGLCKKICFSYVDYSGRVVKEFTVPTRSKDKVYAVGSQCSNLGHLLYLLQTSVADKNLSDVLIELYKHIEQFGNGEAGHQVLFYWRNASLHGDTSFPTIGGTLLSLALIICLFQSAESYEQKKLRILQRLQSNYRFSRMSGHRAHWEFYPPY